MTKQILQINTRVDDTFVPVTSSEENHRVASTTSLLQSEGVLVRFVFECTRSRYDADKLKEEGNHVFTTKGRCLDPSKWYGN